MRAGPIRVYIADDHPLYRDGLRRALSEHPGLTVIGEAADGRTALEQIRSLTPDVAVLDFHMPELDATQVLAAVTREQLPTLGVVVSGDLDGESVYRAVASGARGYLPKHLSRDEVRDAVAAVAHGETVLPGELQGSLMAAVRRHHPDAGAPLTKREREVLQLIAEGATTPQIAARLHVSAATIRSHIQHLYDKLDV